MSSSRIGGSDDGVGGGYQLPEGISEGGPLKDADQSGGTGFQTADPEELRQEPSVPLPHAVRIHGGVDEPIAIGGEQHAPDNVVVPLATSLPAIKHRLKPTPSTSHLPQWEDLVTITEGGDGSVVYTARSYDPSRNAELSWSAVAEGAPNTYRIASQARELLSQGDEAGFNRLAAIWGAMNINTAGMRVTVKGLENLNPEEIYIFAPTHTSSAEFSLLFLVLNGFNVGFLAKEEFKTNPILRALLGRAMEASPRFFFIKREDKRSAGGIAGKAADFLTRDGNNISLVWYPQGTRALGRLNAKGDRMDGDLFAKGRLKKGIGEVALATAEKGRPVKVVPIVINGLGIVQPKGVKPIQTNETVEIVIGVPLDPVSYQSLGEREGAVALTAAVESFYRKHYVAPLSTPEKKSVEEVPTWQAMRHHRVGTWALRNIGGRAIDRFVKWKKPNEAIPPISYHDQDSGIVTFDQLVEAHKEAHQKDYERVGGLVASQLAIQSPEFAERWQGYLDELALARLPFREAMAQYIDDYEAVKHPSYAPVSEATYRLHQAIMDSSLFSKLDPGLRIWAFYTFEARNRYLTLEGEESVDKDVLEQARGRYYRMMGRGIRYRMLNRINSMVGEEVFHRGFKDVARAFWYAPRVHKLKNRAERVELVSELLARGYVSFDARLAEVEREIGELKMSLGKHLNPFSHTRLKFKQLHREKFHLIALRAEFGDDVDVSVVTRLAGDDYQILTKEGPLTVERLLRDPSFDQVRSAWEAKRDAESEWAQAYRADFGLWINREMELYSQSFIMEEDINRIERKMQEDRYTDLMVQARKHGALTAEQEKRFRQALQEYQEKGKKSLEADQGMIDPAGEGKEYKRKQNQIDLFSAWLKLHWTVADIYREIGHPDAKGLKFISAMFPDQVEFLNRTSSKQLEGLRPLLEGMNWGLLRDLYFEIFLGGQDPRKLNRIMGRYGLVATGLGADQMQVYGAGVLAGALGQASGADLLTAGGSLLSEDQVRFGVVPQMAAYSPNHQGFSDYTLMIALNALLGRVGIVYEAKNFDILPVWGPALRLGDSIGFERDKGKGSDSLQRAVAASVDRGVSPLGFDHGTRRLATTANPLATDSLGPFIPREYVFGGSIGEMGEGAKRNGIPLVPVYQDLGFNHDPDIRLSGKLIEGNFRVPYSIHGGAPMGGDGVIAFGDPIPAWVLPDTSSHLAELGIPLIEGNGNGSGNEEGRTVRRAVAAHTEMARYRASLKPLKEVKPIPMPEADEEVTVDLREAVGGVVMLDEKAAVNPVAEGSHIPLSTRSARQAALGRGIQVKTTVRWVRTVGL